MSKSRGKQERRKSKETKIESAIIRRPGDLGFDRATAIRNFRIADLSGAVDVILFPRHGPLKIVLIEAKVARAKDATSKVVGQLLMYYGGALKLGAQGFDLIKEVCGETSRRCVLHQ